MKYFNYEMDEKKNDFYDVLSTYGIDDKNFSRSGFQHG